MEAKKIFLAASVGRRKGIMRVSLLQYAVLTVFSTLHVSDINLTGFSNCDIDFTTKALK